MGAMSAWRDIMTTDSPDDLSVTTESGVERRSRQDLSDVNIARRRMALMRDW